MNYKTICLELIQVRPRLCARLRAERGMLRAVEACASALKENHEAWKALLARERPGDDPRPIASQALELAVAALEEALPDESPPSGEGLSLDVAMAYIRRPTPTE